MRWLVGPLMALAVAAQAAPPPNADPALGAWFRGLANPTTKMGCCSIADCRPIAYRIVGDHYEIKPATTDFTNLPAALLDRWWPVPATAILQNQSNPTGTAIACLRSIGGTLDVMCFIRETES